MAIINASKADSLTAGNGYIEGHTISFKLWDASESTEYDNVEITFVDNSGEEIAPVPFTEGGTAFVRFQYTFRKDLGNTEVYSNSANASTRRAIPVTFTEGWQD